MTQAFLVRDDMERIERLYPERSVLLLLDIYEYLEGFEHLRSRLHEVYA